MNKQHVGHWYDILGWCSVRHNSNKSLVTRSTIIPLSTRRCPSIISWSINHINFVDGPHGCHGYARLGYPCTQCICLLLNIIRPSRFFFEGESYRLLNFQSPYAMDSSPGSWPMAPHWPLRIPGISIFGRQNMGALKMVTWIYNQS